MVLASRLLRVHRTATAAQQCVRLSTSVGGPLTAKCDVDARKLSVSGQPYRVIIGAKAAADHLGAVARASGIHKMLVVRDRDAGAASRTQYAEFLLMQAGIPCFQYTLKRDCATLKDIDDGVATAVRVGADGVLAFGGGSTMDMARSIALVLANGEEAEAYVQGKMGHDLAPAAPHILVPTSSGSGAELSTQALVLDEDGEVKQSFGPPIIAAAVIIDPMLALTVPLHPTVQGALSSLGQCIESYLLGCTDHDAEQIALQGIDLIATAFAQPLVDGRVNLKDIAFREPLALASLASGLAANSSGRGVAHAIAVSMGGVSDVPHAHVSSAFLPYVFDHYATLAEENKGDAFFDALHDKLERVSDRLTAGSGFQGQSIAAWLRYVSQRFALPDAASLELDETLVKGLVNRATQFHDDEFEKRPHEAILEKDDIRAIVDSAVHVVESPPRSETST